MNYGISALIDATAVDVEVEDGIVTLSGIVPNRAARRAAVRTAIHTPGVQEVYDDLVVTSEA